jgi:RimJ/RimL family protein N-acetyltransferase
MIHKQLFESPNLRLMYINPEEDSKVEAAWTYDLDYTQDLMEMPARPLGPVEIKKIHEENQKHAEERGNQYYFAIRLKENDALAGFIRFPFIHWMHSSAWMRLAISDPSILERFGREALELALDYGFRELNLYRIETVLADYQSDLIALIESAGFLMEVRRRQALYRNGSYHDALHFGLLKTEWKPQAVEEAVA